MTRKRPALFRGRHFEDVIILLCVRWYLRYSLTYRDLEEIMLERNLSIDHVTIWRWVQRYAPVLKLRIRLRRQQSFVVVVVIAISAMVITSLGFCLTAHYCPI